MLNRYEDKKEPLKEQPLKKRDSAKKMDNPDYVDTENESLFEMHEDMETVDSVPVEELNDQVKDERKKDHSKDTSSTERKFNP